MTKRHLRFGWRVLGSVCLLGLLACQAQDEPLQLGGVPPPGAAAPGGDGGTNAPADGCTVNYFAQLQLKASANPPKAGGPFEILDAEPFTIEAPIPLHFTGNDFVLKGEDFPDVYFRPPETAADLRIRGAAGTEAHGTYNPDTGEFLIQGFSFSLEIVQKGGTANFLPGVVEFPPVDITTNAITVTGNLHTIEEQGKALDKSDRHLILVTGLTLPTDFSPLTPLNDMIGGGALTARFDGILDQLPEACTSGGGSAPPPVVGDQPKGLQVDIEGQGIAGKIDFGQVFIQPRKMNGKDELDCREAEFRGLESRKVKITNVDSKERVLQFNQPADLDGDTASPLCSGSNEFVRGSLTMEGGTTCETVKVGGKTYAVGTCHLPPGGKASLSFPLLYAPFNYQVDTSGQTPQDRGEFVFAYGEAEPYRIQMTGQAVPDFREVFSLSRVKEGIISPKEIRNGGLLKISLSKPETVLQNLVLKNTGSETWDKVSFQLENGSASDFSILGTNNKLPTSEGAAPGLLYFDVQFKPGGKKVSRDRLLVRLEKTSSSPGSPTNIVDLSFDLVGAVGLPPLKGKVLLYFDFFTAMIDHVALSEPIESNDFRERPEFAPTPLEMNFTETEDETIRSFTINSPKVNLLDPTLTAEDRQGILRVFTARASYGKNGQRMDPGDTADNCYEPSNILQPYKIGDCSYFYWTDLVSDPGYYDDESGQLIMPSVHLNMQNPYHSDIFGIWPASNPNTNPDYRLNTPLWISFSTHTLDKKVFEDGEVAIPLVPDPRVDNGDLTVKGKHLGKPCPEAYLDGAFPHLQCYVSSDQRYMQGLEVRIREDKPSEYDIVLVGIARFEPGTSDPDLPWFLGDNSGSLIYIAIQGRLVPQ